MAVNIAHNIPNCKFYNTSSQAHKGDSTLEIADSKFKWSFECKSHVNATISKDKISQPINDTEVKEADACILIYENSPKYCNGNIYDMMNDKQAIFPFKYSFQSFQNVDLYARTYTSLVSHLTVF